MKAENKGVLASISRISFCFHEITGWVAVLKDCRMALHRHRVHSSEKRAYRRSVLRVEQVGNDNNDAGLHMELTRLRNATETLRRKVERRLDLLRPSFTLDQYV